MTNRYATIALGLALVAGSGCEQASQELPLGPGSNEAVRRVIGPDGGVVSTPAGLSVRFEAGSVARTTEVTVIHRADTDVGATVNGAIVPGTVFDVGPSAVELGTPARMSLQVPPATLETTNPMALTAVVVAGPVRQYLSHASVDLRTGILKTDLPRLGTVAVRISDDVIPVGSGSLSEPGTATRPALRAPAVVSPSSAPFTMTCGEDGHPDCSSTDAIALTLTEDLYDAFNGCVQFIDPVVRMDLTVEQTEGDAGRAAGTMAFSGTVRYETGSDGTACGSGSGSVQSIAVNDTIALGTDTDRWTPITFDAANQTLTLWQTSEGTETLDCDCGSDLFSATEIWIGQTSQSVTYEGLSGEVTWSVRLRR